MALAAQDGSQGYDGVGLYGYQDTLLANQGKQLYAKSKIVGPIDFTFGQLLCSETANNSSRPHGRGVAVVGDSSWVCYLDARPGTDSLSPEVLKRTSRLRTL